MGPLAVRMKRMIFGVPVGFEGSARYWAERYASGGNSGIGSYDQLAEFKAEILNAFVAEKNTESIIEFGCGDGNQLTLARYPKYLGFDVSPDALALCRERFKNDPTKTFKLVREYRGEQASLVLSLDVVYHLVEGEVFEQYMKRLFQTAQKHVIVYSSNSETLNATRAAHEKHREFTAWVQENEPSWRLIQHIPNRYPYRRDDKTGSFADFYIFEK